MKFKNQDRVFVKKELCPKTFTKDASGTVLGVAYDHIVVAYIVRMDVPVEVKGETWDCIPVSEGHLIAK